MAKRNADWTWDETVLAFEVYVAHGCINNEASVPGKRSQPVLELSDELRSAGIHDLREQNDKFRNGPGVYRKLGNLQAAERQIRLERGDATAESLPKGSERNSSIDREVFAYYYPDALDQLSADAAAIRAALDGPHKGREAIAKDAAVDGGGIAEYEARGAPGGKRERAESVLVEDFRSFMEAKGHEVVGRHYRPPGQARPFRADLLVRKSTGGKILVEAKAYTERSSIRMALAQLVDYRRFEDGALCAVLLPTEPTEDIRDYLGSVGICCVWPFGDGFRDTIGGRAIN